MKFIDLQSASIIYNSSLMEAVEERKKKSVLRHAAAGAAIGGALGGAREMGKQDTFGDKPHGPRSAAHTRGSFFRPSTTTSRQHLMSVGQRFKHEPTMKSMSSMHTIQKNAAKKMGTKPPSYTGMIGRYAKNKATGIAGGAENLANIRNKAGKGALLGAGAASVLALRNNRRFKRDNTNNK
jgi:hypothetical protein